MKKYIIFGILIVLLSIGWFLVSPLFLNKEIEEAFPPIATLPTAQEIASMSDEERDAKQDEIMKMAEQQPGTIIEDTMPARGDQPNFPQVIAKGKFQDADTFHQGAGTAAVIDVDGSERILRFEDFSVTNGPDLRVFLTEHLNPKNQDDVKNGAYVEIAKLKGNKGNQNYSIPHDLDIDNYNTVLIYCKPFHVVFATAPLE